MNWYKGGIAEAVTVSKQKNTIFLVYTEGNDDSSRNFNKILEEPDVALILGSSDFTAIKIEGNSETYNNFVAIYKPVPIPSIYFIGKSGVVLDIVKDSTQLKDSINKVLAASGKSTAKFLEAEQVSEAATSVKNDVAEKAEGSSDSKEENKNTSPPKTPELSAEEKVARAKELLEKKRETKRLEEEEAQKAKELERRKMGQDVQKLKAWQHEQEMKNLLEAREKEKREEKLARDRVLEQIRQDKEDRANKFSNAANSSPPEKVATPPTVHKPKVLPNQARLQFKLPDGSSKTKEFDINTTLLTVRGYVAEITTLRIENFALSTTFPRREFTATDNDKTLVDLELVPNAVVLVLPISHGTVSTSNNGFVMSLFWSLLTPILTLFQYLRGFVTGNNANPRNNRTATNDTNESNRKRPVESAEGENSRGYKRKPGESTVVHRQGNIHRLSDKQDSDEDNNTWNGNSTQQM